MAGGPWQTGATWQTGVIGTLVQESTGRPHRGVQRITSILEAAAVRPDGVTVPELMALLEAPKSSVHDLVRGLLAAGYLREQSGRYVLGPAFLAFASLPRDPVLELAREAMAELLDAFNETVVLATRVGMSVVYVEALESSHEVRYSPVLRSRRPLYPPSAGKAILAHMSPRFQESYLGERLPPESRADAGRELAAVRDSGVAYNRGETAPTLSAAASPILVDRRAVGALVVAGPSERIQPRLPEIGRRLCATVRELVADSRALDGRRGALRRPGAGIGALSC